MDAGCRLQPRGLALLLYTLEIRERRKQLPAVLLERRGYISNTLHRAPLRTQPYIVVNTLRTGLVEAFKSAENSVAYLTAFERKWSGDGRQHVPRGN